MRSSRPDPHSLHPRSCSPRLDLNRSLNIHRSKQQDAYLRALKAFVAEKEKEIEAVCARNYQVRPIPVLPLSAFADGHRGDVQDFVGSVSALLRVRQGTVSLKHRVVELNDEVQKSGGGVADKARSSYRTPRCLH